MDGWPCGSIWGQRVKTPMQTGGSNLTGDALFTPGIRAIILPLSNPLRTVVRSKSINLRCAKPILVCSVATSPHVYFGLGSGLLFGGRRQWVKIGARSKSISIKSPGSTLRLQNLPWIDSRTYHYLQPPVSLRRIRCQERLYWGFAYFW